MSVPPQQMLEELRKAEHLRDLLSELERRLSAGNTDLENLLRQLEQLGQSLPESDPIRLLIEDAVGAARTRDSIKAGSDVSRSRSASRERSPLFKEPYKAYRVAQTSKCKNPLVPQKDRCSPEEQQLSLGFPEEELFRISEKILSYLEQGALLLRSSVAEGALKRGDLPFECGASSTDSAYIGWLNGRFNHQSHDVILWQRLRQLLERSYVAL